jgi:hypothetical protein
MFLLGPPGGHPIRHFPVTLDLLLDVLSNDVKRKGLILQSGLAKLLRRHSVILTFIDINFQKPLSFRTIPRRIREAWSIGIDGMKSLIVGKHSMVHTSHAAQNFFSTLS